MDWWSLIPADLGFLTEPLVRLDQKLLNLGFEHKLDLIEYNLAMNYTKMEGLGNTFLIFTGPFKPSAEEVKDYCAQNNCDGILVAVTISEGLVEMKYWNADGSVAEMCGNGIRCVARFAVDNKLVSAGEFNVKTDAGVLKAKWDGLDAEAIEVQIGKFTLADTPVEIEDREYCVANVGNPHAITFVEDVEDSPVDVIGPKVETNEYFPNRTNVEFVSIESPQVINLRVWERGVGETKACGTGMVAAALTAQRLKKIELPVEVRVPGGSAKIWIDESGYGRMIGPANYV